MNSQKNDYLKYDEPTSWKTVMLENYTDGEVFHLIPLESRAEPFNPEGGDTGLIAWNTGELRYKKVEQGKNRKISYAGKLAGNIPEPGMELSFSIDAETRIRNAAHHSFSHLITAAFRKLIFDEIIATSTLHQDGGELCILGQGSMIQRVPEIWSYIEKYFGIDQKVEIISLPRDAALDLSGIHFASVVPKSVRELRIIHVGSDLPWIPCRGVHVKNLTQIHGASLVFAGNLQNNLVLKYSVQHNERWN